MPSRLSYRKEQEFCPVALDFGRITFDAHWVLYLFGAADWQTDPTWGIFETIDFGFILMVDSASPETFHICQRQFNLVKYYLSIPIVIAANYQDKPDAWHPDDLRIALRIDPEIPIIPCCAKTGDGINDVMIALCEAYLKHHFPAEEN